MCCFFLQLVGDSLIVPPGTPGIRGRCIRQGEVVVEQAGLCYLTKHCLLI